MFICSTYDIIRTKYAAFVHKLLSKSPHSYLVIQIVIDRSLTVPLLNENVILLVIRINTVNALMCK